MCVAAFAAAAFAAMASASVALALTDVGATRGPRVRTTAVHE